MPDNLDNLDVEAMAPPMTSPTPTDSTLPTNVKASTEPSLTFRLLNVSRAPLPQLQPAPAQDPPIVRLVSLVLLGYLLAYTSLPSLASSFQAPRAPTT
jgi:hypothetical protein